MQIKTGETVQLIEDRYTLIKQLSEGGNGVVWKIKAKKDDQEYAIKFLKAEKDSKKVKQRFMNEIQFCYNNNHTNIIKVIDYGEYNNQMCYVMSLYNETLDDVIKLKLDIPDYLDYILQICEGIQFLHSNNVIHRDIKPENILFENNKLVLADLGIAHFTDADITANNELLANRSYAAPEQKKKGHSKKVGTPADIYAVGCIINEIFTKRNPAGTNFKNIKEFYPYLVTLDDLVIQCMNQDPKERPTIDWIITEIKLLKGQIEEELNEIMFSLEEDYPSTTTLLPEEKLESLLNFAANDILFANYIFHKASSEELSINNYDYNYNCHIHYKIDDYLKRKYFSALLHQYCERKFSYESHVYDKEMGYKSLDSNCETDKHIYKKFYDLMLRHGEKSTRTLKLFASCCNYHCEELIDSISSIIKEVRDLEDAPVLYIVLKLRQAFDHNRAFTTEFILSDHILINWDETQPDGDKEFGKSLKLPKDNDYVIQILDAFSERYNINYNIENEKHYISFNDENSYFEFKDYSLELAKPYYQFEGDVLDLVRTKREYNGIIELKPLDLFEVRNVLAKILGFRNDY